MAATFRFATYNLLAPEYASVPEGSRDFYAARREFLPWKQRMPRLVARIRDLGADVVCLQEVSRLHLERFFGIELETLGYALESGRRPVPRPDTVVVLAKRTTVQILRREDIVLPGESGKVALVVEARIANVPETVRIACIHLRWSADGTSQTAQLEHLLRALDTKALMPTVIAGDLNFDVQRQPVWSELASRGYVAAHASGAPTWAADGRSERTDDVLVRGLSVQGTLPIPVISATPGLPDEHEPSDHVPLVADLAFTSS